MSVETFRAWMPLLAIPAMALTMLVSCAFVFYGIPHARQCITENHPHCARRLDYLVRARRILRLWRTTVAACWAAVLIWDVIGLTSLWSRVAIAAYLAALLVLWSQLRWPPELQGRLVQLDREQAQPWDVIA